MAGDDALAVEIRPEAPGSAAARAVLTAYFADIVGRHHRRAATGAEVAAAMHAEPSDDLCPPGGLLLLAWQDGTVLGCAGLRLLHSAAEHGAAEHDGLGEVTRLFVLPRVRRRGLGQRLLAAVEDAARDGQLTRLRLDTSDYLTEARRLYTRNGYQEVAPFSDGQVANLWFGKALG
jgi:GNAT superfamily N-acetyltransferase